MREAINLAYDRETMTQKVMRLGEPPAYSIVPPGIANYPVRVEMGIKRDAATPSACGWRNI